MPKSHPEAVKIQVGGEEYELWLNSLAFRLYELETGETLKQRDFTGGDVSIAMMGRLAYIGLLPNEGFDLSEKEFLKIAAKEDQEQIMEKVGLAIQRMMGSTSKDEDKSGDPTEGNGEAGE